MRHSFLKATFDENNFKTYRANCHCGLVKYKVDVSPPLPVDGGEHEVVTCNDSLCMRTGTLNVYVPAEKITWIQGRDRMKSYQYQQAFRHFCPECGIQMTITLAEPFETGREIVGLNVRAFHGIDYDKIKIVYVDMKDEEPLYDVNTMPNA